jgi:hypothetical protein
MLSRYLFVGRRAAGRRDGEYERVYVDRPGGWIIAAFAILVLLSLLDAAFTLKHIEHGATEANPFMRAALHLGDAAFVIIKTVVTVFAVAFLCLHKNWPLGRLCLVLALVGYTLLTAYHIWGRLSLTSLL